MLARVGNSLYWAGRYIERSDHTARYLNINYFYIKSSNITDDNLTESSGCGEDNNGVGGPGIPYPNDFFQNIPYPVSRHLSFPVSLNQRS